MAGIRMENKIYEVGMYCRLSKDDGTDNESASIATQKSILTDYVKKQGWHLAKTYVDDGYSGTNFQRPSFQNMIKDIESGLINCVITKDLSRLGRNYLDCGLYLEVFFPEHNVRYIAVNDGVDTLNKSAMDITPFRNILNEMYSADVSVKIKSAYRARFQQGKFMGTTAPYGYVKDPADHNHLLIDDKVAHVVREIFDLALAGNGIAKIRKHINKQHILRPAAYAAEQGATGYERYFEENEENRYIWSENSVRGILRSPIYAGNLAGYKRIAANMKSKKRPSKLPEEWEVIPDTHEGIVTQEEFDTVQQLITSRRLPENKGGFENIFAGVIKCADCGYAMRAMSANRRKRPDIIDCVQYSCNNYGRYGNIMCTAHSIEARDLFNAVLTDINRFADMAVNDEKAVRAIEKRLTETDQSKAKALEKEQRKLNKRLAELDRLFSSLYEDKVMERITERNFEMMSGKYQKEQLEIEARLKEVTETLSDSYEKTQGVRDFLSLIRNYQGIKELDATIINALIDKILVSEREKLTDGMVRQEIKIYYKFIGFVGELHITPTKRWTALKPKNCTVCGVEYVPRSGISKYCPACAKKIQREKSNESKRRSRERNRQACIELSAKNDRLMLFDWVGLDNFKTLFDSGSILGSTFWSVLGWTIVWAFFATFSNYIFGMILSLLINRKGTRAKGFWRFCFVLSCAVPMFVSLLIMRTMLQPEGAINVLLRNIGLIASDASLPFFTDTTWARVTVIIINIWVGVPYTLLQLTGVLQNIPEELYEAAKVDGANAFQTFTKITLPYMLYVTTPYLIVTFTGNVNNFNVIYLLSGGDPVTNLSSTAGKTDLLVTWLYKLTIDKQYYNIGAVIGIMTFIILAIGALFTYRNSKSYKEEGGF